MLLKRINTIEIFCEKELKIKCRRGVGLNNNYKRSLIENNYKTDMDKESPKIPL